MTFKEFRPVTLLAALSKVAGKAAASQLNEYSDAFDILPPTQSGFRKEHSTTTALLDITDDVITAMDAKLVTSLTLLDFSKAFDTLNHDMLLAKLHHIGLCHDAVSWFRSFLTARIQKVRLYDGADTTFSKPIYVTTGVPQGSIRTSTVLFIHIRFE